MFPLGDTMLAMGLYSEPSSLMGTAAAQCIEHARYPKVPQRARRRSTKIAVSPPQADDALEPGCNRCGVAGVIHPSPADCIDTLRDLIAELTEDPLARKIKTAIRA